jgi:hypothetical protein
MRTIEIILILFNVFLLAWIIGVMIIDLKDALKQKTKKTLFVNILKEMEKLHKDGHEANFILVNSKNKIPDFDRVLGIPIEMAVLPKGVQFVVAERKEKEE